VPLENLQTVAAWKLNVHEAISTFSAAAPESLRPHPPLRGLEACRQSWETRKGAHRCPFRNQDRLDSGDRRFMRSLLIRTGATGRSATSIQAPSSCRRSENQDSAIRVLRQEKVDIAPWTFSFPGRDGLEFSKEARKLSNG